jgi:ribosomal-protein-alanine N-acetyltransferase
MIIIIQTPRLIIREFLPEEEGLFLAILSDERLTDYLPKRSIDDNQIIFRNMLADYEQGIKLTSWGIFNKTDHTLIGLGILKAVNGEPDKSELGYVIHHAFKGMGIATELSETLLNYGFSERKLTEIFAVTHQDNIASQRVLIKAGLTQGDNLLRNGEWVSCFKITADDWLLQYK